MTLPPPVAFAGDPRQLAMGNCYLGELGDRPMSSPTAGGPAAFPPRLTLAAQVAHGQRRRTQWRRSQVPRNSSGDKTGTNRRTADARFSTTGGISPDSPQSRSAGLRDRTLYLGTTRATRRTMPNPPAGPGSRSMRYSLGRSVSAMREVHGWNFMVESAPPRSLWPTRSRIARRPSVKKLNSGNG